MNKYISVILMIALAICTNLLVACDVGTYRYQHADLFTAGNNSYQTNGIEGIDINYISGEVTVQFTETDQIAITETGSEQYPLYSALIDGKLTIHFVKNDTLLTGLNLDKALLVEVPNTLNTLDIELDLVSANANISDTTCDQLEVDSVSGNISIGNINCTKTEIDSVSGKIDILGITTTDKLEINSVSGTVKANNVNSNDIEIDTVSGDIAIILANIPNNSQMDINTTSGKTKVSLPQGIANGATIEMSTVSGNIDCLGNHGKEHTYKNGTMDIEINTTSGNITVVEYAK